MPRTHHTHASPTSRCRRHGTRQQPQQQQCWRGRVRARRRHLRQAGAIGPAQRAAPDAAGANHVTRVPCRISNSQPTISLPGRSPSVAQCLLQESGDATLHPVCNLPTTACVPPASPSVHVLEYTPKLQGATVPSVRTASAPSACSAASAHSSLTLRNLPPWSQATAAAQPLLLLMSAKQQLQHAQSSIQRHQTL
jgi:hypothetical protein